MNIREINTWFADEVNNNYSHMFVVLNKKLNKYYPIYVSFDENLFEKINEIKNIVNQEIIEIYTYAYNIDRQSDKEFNIYPNEAHINSKLLEMFFEEKNLKAQDILNIKYKLISENLSKEIENNLKQQLLKDYLSLTNYYSKMLMKGETVNYIIWHIIFKNFQIKTFDSVNYKYINYCGEVIKNKEIVYLHLSALCYAFYKLKKENLITEKPNEKDLFILQRSL